jgi:alpha-1,2-mannosyltransferase
LALASLPALGVTYVFDFRRLGVAQTRPKPGQSSPYTLVALRLSGFYLWLAVMSLQPHKPRQSEAHPILRSRRLDKRRFRPTLDEEHGHGGIHAQQGIRWVLSWFPTKYIPADPTTKASQTCMFSYLALALVLPTMILSVSRIYALGHYYRSPYDVTV